jgi:PDZ domain-containing secreted protein
MDFKKGYYYLHTNNELIFKPEIVVGDATTYFDGPFVEKYWHIKTKEEHEKMLNEVQILIKRNLK